MLRDALKKTLQRVLEYRRFFAWYLIFLLAFSIRKSYLVTKGDSAPPPQCLAGLSCKGGGGDWGTTWE